MFAALAFASCLFVGDGSASESDARMAALTAQDVAIASVIAEARQDFEARYDELGLVGSAPLAGTESARDAGRAAARARARAERERSRHVTPASTDRI
jgi:hypothetical protein